MSSAPEVLVARQMDLKVLMLSLVSNVSYPPSAIRETTLEEVIAVAEETGGRMGVLIREVVKNG